MKAKIIILVFIFSFSLLLGGCSLLSQNDKGLNSTVNVNLVTSPAVNYASPSAVVSKNAEEEVILSTETDFESINTDLDKIDNLESVTVE